MNKQVTKLHPEVEITDPTLAGLALLRAPFPDNQISKLPKETKAQAEQRKREQDAGRWPAKCSVCEGYHHPNAVHLDYVGHAALTDRLLDVDPMWSWEPLATRDGLPALDANGGLWIKLTVCGVSRLGYGAADGKRGGDAIKELIGDALRNAAMRFGAALDLWHKGDLHAHNEEPAATAEELAINLLRGCATKELFAEAWAKNKDGWKGVMDGPTYARVVAEMKRLAAKFQADAPAAELNNPAPPPPTERPISSRAQAQPPQDDGFGIGDDDLPNFD
ncbi:hypothetical protein ACO2Q0_02870 [Phenylobacterium sp. VNQ135]|uniref:hypothetical protein n=1 Tax=Phenylobacterium sp. VNQ135 TaxID=3400922 RepID=UPI003C02B136